MGEKKKKLMCQRVKKGADPAGLLEAMESPKYECKKCKLPAEKKKHLCKPEKL